MRMTPLHHSILSTLALHAAEKHPHLSLQEIYDFLHKNPSEKQKRAPTLLEVAESISELADTGKMTSRNGTYALAGIAHREKTGDEALKKIRQTRLAVSFLQAVPFVRAIAITGSVSFDNAHRTSDLDILLIARKGHAWTARLFSLAVLELFGKRRDKKGKTDKICLNYILAEDAEPSVRNVASATMFKRAMPLFGASALASFTDRPWMHDFLHHPKIQTGVTRDKDKAFFVFLRMCGEFLLTGAVGSAVEKWAHAWQTKRLSKKKTSFGESPHFIFTHDIIMLHHPAPKNKEVLECYERIMKELKEKVK